MEYFREILPQQSSHMLSSLASTWSRSLPASLPPVHMSTRSGAAEKDEKRVTQRAHAHAEGACACACAAHLLAASCRRHCAHPGSRSRERTDLQERSARCQGRRPDSACRRRAASLPARPKASHLRGVPKSTRQRFRALTQARLRRPGQQTAPARTGRALIRARAHEHAGAHALQAGRHAKSTFSSLLLPKQEGEKLISVHSKEMCSGT